jgi:hypothetical protein
MPSVSQLIQARRRASGPTIDYYKNAWGKEPSGTTTLVDLLDAIRGDEYAAAVARVRRLLSEGKGDEANEAKRALPAVSLSGCVDGRRAKAVEEGRFQHSGLLQIDLDAKDNPGKSVDEMRDVLTSDPRMVAVFITPSGNGVKGVARVPADASTHRACFLAAESHFASLGLKIDPACKDPVRLCFVSHDPAAWLRMDTSEMFEPVELHALADLDDDEEHDNAPNATTTSASGGLVIRGGRAPLDAATVREMLRVIPYPGYEDWLKISNAVWKAVGIEEGTALLQEWAPEKNPGDYEKHAKYPLQDITTGTLLFFAQAYGYAPRHTSVAVAKHTEQPAPQPKDKNAIPEHIFPVPNGDIGNDLAARHIMALIGATRTLFMRAGTVHEVLADKVDDDVCSRLEPLKPVRLTSLIEEFGPRVMAREKREDGTFRWRSKIMAANHCDMLLNSSAARDFLPPIQQITGSPVLANTPDGPKTLEHGWHPHAGGTFVTGHHKIPAMSYLEAIPVFLDLLEGFNFASPSDASRAAASFLSPALKIGRWIDDDFPLDVAEADQSQAGKSYRHKLIAAVYGETPYTITNSTGGVGSFDERVGGALIAGRPIITLENIRGRIDSQALESSIRGMKRVTARTFRACVEVETAPFLWQLSTNGAELTRDLANRAVITRIRKQSLDYKYPTYAEGEIIHHVRANQPKFLAAIHAIVREWHAQGCQRTDESRHDFRTWTQIMDWIVQNLLGLDPLMADHREEQLRTANPKLQWLRDVLHAIITEGHDITLGLTASDFAEASEENEINIPGRRATSVEPAEQTVGKILSRLYKEVEGETLRIDGRNLTRLISHEYDPVNRKDREKKVYVIEP